MRFVVLGAGALGSIIAGHLARAGEDVMLVARGDRARYVQQHGITVTGVADFTSTCPVITDPLVQLVTNNYSILGCQGRCCSHDFGYWLGGPVEGMRMLIPFLDELVELGAKMIFRFNIYHT
jgi:ketopantoate reductase PanE/ApbA-like protein